MTCRLVISFILACVISVATFWGVQFSINSQKIENSDDNNYTKMVEFVRLKQNTHEEILKQRKRPKQPETEKNQSTKPIATKIANLSKQPQIQPLEPITAPEIEFSAIDTGTDFSTEIAVSAETGLSNTDIATDLTPVFRVKPSYPRRALRMNIEGWVKLEFTITKDGSVKEIKIVAATPPKVFEKSAIKALKQWRFQPAEVNGEAVEQRAVQVIRYEKE